MRIGKLSWIAGALVCGMVGVAHGEIRTFAMEGTVSYISDPLGMLDWVDVGSDRLVYTFSFDSDAVDADNSPSVGVYDGLSASLQVGSTPITVSAPRIIIQHPVDLFRMQSHLIFGSYQGDAFLTLADQTDNNALTDAVLPIVPYDLGPWQLKYFGIGIYVPQPGYPDTLTIGFGGDIESFYVIPEPTSLTLLFPGLLVIRRKHT